MVLVGAYRCYGNCELVLLFFFFSSRRRHTRFDCDWSSDVCSSDLGAQIDRPERDALVIQLGPLLTVAGPAERAIYAVAPLVHAGSQRGSRRDGLERRPGWVLAERGAVEERPLRIGRVARDGRRVGRDERVEVEGRAARDREDLAAPGILSDDRALLIAERVLG